MKLFRTAKVDDEYDIANHAKKIEQLEKMAVVLFDEMQEIKRLLREREK